MPRDKLISRTKGAWCQMNFEAGEVTPCRTNALIHQQASSKKYPVYEHHPITHKPFKNILGLRQAKMENFLNLTTWLPHVKFISVETLLQSGVDELLEELYEEYGKCFVFVRAGVTIQIGLGYCKSEVDDTNFELVTTESASASYDEMKYLTCKIHWGIEEKLGYSPDYRYLVNKRTKKRERCKDVHTIHA